MQYTYDANGNRNSVQKGTQTPVTTTFDTAGLSISSSDGTSYSYDALGDLLGTPGGTTPWSYGYDTWGRTVSAANGPTSLTYGYDALDRTIVRTLGTTSTTYGYAGGSQNLVSSTTSGAATNYAWGAGGPLASSSGGLVRAYEPNLHGDAAMLALVSGGSESKGDTTGTVAYGPFGDRRVTTGEGTGLLFGFQSDPTDPLTGLVDEGTRLYDALQGRFSTRDVIFGNPMSPLTLNQYSYGSENPVSLVDPNGMCADPAECPPPLGATRAVADRWRSLSNSAGVRVTHAYTWTHEQYATYFNGASPGARQMMEPRPAPAPSAPRPAAPKSSTKVSSSRIPCLNCLERALAERGANRAVMPTSALIGLGPPGSNPPIDFWDQCAQGLPPQYKWACTAGKAATYVGLFWWKETPPGKPFNPEKGEYNPAAPDYGFYCRDPGFSMAYGCTPTAGGS